MEGIRNMEITTTMRNQVACEGRTDKKSVQWEQVFIVDISEKEWHEMLGRQLAIEYNRLLGLEYGDRAKLHDLLTKPQPPIKVSDVQQRLENMKGGLSPEEKLKKSANLLLGQGMSKEDLLKLILGES